MTTVLSYNRMRFLRSRLISDLYCIRSMLRALETVSLYAFISLSLAIRVAIAIATITTSSEYLEPTLTYRHCNIPSEVLLCSEAHREQDAMLCRRSQFTTLL